MPTKQCSHHINTSTVSKENLWKVWSDVNQWPKWNSDIESTQLDAPFCVGSQFILKPKGGPKVKIKITEATPYKSFTDVTIFPFAKMHSQHAVKEITGGLEVSHTVTMTGPLSFLWWNLVGKNVAAGMKEQADKMLQRAKDA